MNIVSLLLTAAAAMLLSTASASAQVYEEVEIIRENPAWVPPPRRVRVVEEYVPCRDVVVRRHRPNGSVVIRRTHRCD